MAAGLGGSRRVRVRFGSLAFVLSVTTAFAGAIATSSTADAAAAANTPAHSLASEAQPPAGFGVKTVLSDLQEDIGGVVTGFAYASNQRIFIARKTGVVNVWDNGHQYTYVDLRDEVNSYQSRGLIGLALDPNFATNGRVYLLFTQELDPKHPDSTEPAGGELISLTNKKGKPDVADPTSRITLMTGFQSIATLHSVAGLRFGLDGSLFVGLGDGNGNEVGAGQSLEAQNLDSLNGKILRIDPTTGLGVPSNPYYDASSPDSVRSRVFAWGFRNPFRFTVDPQDGSLLVGDVGWNTWEMFNRFPLTTDDPTVDRNAGWPCYEGGDGLSLVQPEYAASPITGPTCATIYTAQQGGTGPGALPPLYAYLHTDPGGNTGSAIVGGPLYNGTSNYPESYIGQEFIGDYGRARMQTLDLGDGVATDFGTAGTWGVPGQGVVDSQIAPDGNVAVLTLNPAELDEITYGSNNPPAAVSKADHTGTTGSSLTVKFSSAGSNDPEGHAITYSWDFGDGSPLSKAKNPKHTYTGKGVYNAVLTVTGTNGSTHAAPIQIDVGILPPVVTLTSPSSDFKFQIGTTVAVKIKATDPQDGTVDPKQVVTEVDYWTGGHDFPVTGFSRLKGSFVAADQGFVTAFYRITTTATNSYGLTGSATIDVQPKTTKVTVQSTPEGVTMSIDDAPQVTPYTFTTIVGSAREVAAPHTATVDANDYTFASWTAGKGAPSSDLLETYTVPGGPLKLVAKYDAD